MGIQVSKNAKVTLTIEQLQKLMNQSVRIVLDEYISNGLLGNPEAIEAQSNNQLAEQFLALQEQMSAIGNKILGNSNSRNSNSNYDYIVENADKFENVKKTRSNLSSTLSSLAQSAYGNGDTFSLDSSSINGSGFKQSSNPQIDKKIEQSLQKEKTGNTKTDMYLDMIAETDGIAETK